MPLLRRVADRLPAPFPVVRAICWALLLTGVAGTAFAADRVAEIPCDTQCFSTLSWRVIPRGILACGATQAVTAAVALLLPGRPRRALASASLVAALACGILLSTFVAVTLLPPRDGGCMDIDVGTIGLFILYGVGLAYLSHHGFEAVRRAAK